MPGSLDTFEGNDPFARAHRSGSSTSSKKNDAFAKHPEFNSGRVSIGAENTYAKLYVNRLFDCSFLLVLNMC